MQTAYRHQLVPPRQGGELIRYGGFRGTKERFVEPRDTQKIHKTAFELPESDDIALYFQEFRGLLYWIYFLAWSNFSSTSELRESILSTVNDKKLITKQKKIYASKIKDTQRFISKSFFGIFHIEDSLKMYPDAKFIILFRDPKEVIPSTLSLEINIQRTLNDFDNQPKALQERYIKNLYQEVLLYFEKLYEVYHIEHPNLFKLKFLPLYGSQNGVGKDYDKTDIKEY